MGIAPPSDAEGSDAMLAWQMMQNDLQRQQQQQQQAMFDMQQQQQQLQAQQQQAHQSTPARSSAPAVSGAAIPSEGQSSNEVPADVKEKKSKGKKFGKSCVMQ